MYAKLAAVIIVIIHAVSNCSRVAAIAFSGIDGSNSCPESLPWCNSRVAIAIQHPKPESSLPWDWIILSYDVKVIQAIEPQVISSRTIIIIPAKYSEQNNKLSSTYQSFSTHSNSLNTTRIKRFLNKSNLHLWSLDNHIKTNTMRVAGGHDHNISFQLRKDIACWWNHSSCCFSLLPRCSINLWISHYIC